jgi:hypothetical protein
MKSTNSRSPTSDSLLKNENCSDSKESGVGIINKSAGNRDQDSKTNEFKTNESKTNESKTSVEKIMNRELDRKRYLKLVDAFFSEITDEEFGLLIKQRYGKAVVETEF